MNSGNCNNRHRLTSTRRPKGFSLLEILVVMIILLIGILSIIRLFPGGFLTIQRTGEQTTGTQLADQQLEALRSLAVVPDYLLPALPDDQGKIHVINNVRPDDLTDATDADLQNYATAETFTILPGYIGYFFSDINRIRYVKGETFHVPVSNPNILDSNNVPYGSLYMIQLGPTFNLFNQGANGYTDSLNVYGAALTRTLQSAVATSDRPDPNAILRGDSEYAIDYDNHLIAFFPRVAAVSPVTTYRDFLITFDYYDTTSNPPILRTQTGKVRVPDVDPAVVAQGVPPTPIWQNVFDPTLNPPPTNAKDAANIRQESEDVSRAFKLITTDTSNQQQLTFFKQPAGPGPKWSEDPYEYAWYSDQEGTANANAGVLIFNPRGHVSFLANNVSDDLTKEQSAGFTNNQSLVARVDYLIYDNHIIRDSKTVASSAPYVIKLSLANVLTNGDVLDDGSTFTGIFNNSSGGSGPDVLIFNANNGTEVGEISKGQATGLVKYTLDATSGTITLNEADVNAQALQGKSLRIFYRTQKNWGQQVQKASSLYTPTTGPDSLDYKTFLIGGNGNGQATRIYFAPSEAGKTVTLSEFYLQTASGVINAPFKNATFQIQNDPGQFTAMGTKGLTYPWIDITEQFPTADNEHIPQGGVASDPITGFTATPSGRAVNNVRGLSIKSRVIWKDQSRFRQINEDSVLPTERL